MSDPIELSWDSTPQLWCAIHQSYDGATDSRCPIGWGRTKSEAIAHLRDHNAEYCPKCDSGDTDFVYDETASQSYQKCAACGEEWMHEQVADSYRVKP